MLRAFLYGAARTVSSFSGTLATTQRIHYSQFCKVSNHQYQPVILPARSLTTLLSPFLRPVYPLPNTQLLAARNVTKFSLIKGKRKSVKAVIKRFKRLDWGIWIRTHSGRHKKLFKKSAKLKRRLRQHVFTNATQSWLLDKMVTSFWRRPKHYIDDPYAPYHRRDEYFATKSKTFKV